MCSVSKYYTYFRFLPSYDFTAVSLLNFRLFLFFFQMSDLF